MHTFPMNPRRVLPHRPPLLLLDSVDGIDADGARATVILRPDNPFVNAEGLLEPLAYAEMIAQCFAAFGASQRAMPGDEEKPPIGYLAALRDVRVLAHARLSDVLTVSARRTASLGAITVVEGEVRRGNALLATGQCKVFVTEGEI